MGNDLALHSAINSLLNFFEETIETLGISN